MKQISPERLHEILRYDPATGKLYFRFKQLRRPAGAEAGSSFRKGDLTYQRVTVDGDRVYGHQIVWWMFRGAIPAGMLVDHINGDGCDNRVENLRLVTRAENARNARRRADNVSGHGGVSRCAWTGKWRARFVAEKRSVWLGRFDTFDGAVAAVEAAKVAAGFTSRHGRE